MIDITPNPIAFTIGSFPVHWYGICYAVGLVAVYLVLVREARRRGQNPEFVGNGMVVVAIAALIGGRLYHVIDQWALYAADPITAILPIARQANGSYAFAGFSGLGVPGGIITGTIAAWYLTRRWHGNFWIWADIVAPGLFVMQAVGRLGNFFNQELYGPPTTLPWGIAIDCPYRIAAYPCDLYPVATTHFQPLFLYESLSGLIGAAVLLWLARRPRTRLVPGDLLLIFFVWYGTTRFVLEFFRSGNWTFFGIATAQIVSAAFIVVGLAMLWYRHGPGRPALEAPDDELEAPDDEGEVEETDTDATDTRAVDREPDRPPA
ncbi:MAG TPA: prolipoprotein diacylglyceryl transferase [Candidatus Limnocylindrales bacterium]|jgi:phosphatidylglycerol:prolipoprotein diacylglycerol transferase|nr:prolipoprotein diacylglyceryl transferase [Candidatus Limnocylindrales bacterium]